MCVGCSKNQTEDMLDAETIFAFKTIRHINPRVSILTELGTTAGSDKSIWPVSEIESNGLQFPPQRSTFWLPPAASFWAMTLQRSVQPFYICIESESRSDSLLNRPCRLRVVKCLFPLCWTR
eukprot:GILJ01027285.1.p1 GENE.GILJ01027285.1~~GILJ01027285.1.p1  ORF type:complete len:122 (+),score=14.75 GILJ01027285.1:316-681(+)